MSDVDVEVEWYVVCLSRIVLPLLAVAAVAWGVS